MIFLCKKPIVKTHFLNFRKEGTFPDIDTPNKLFNGIPFKDLPIFNIRVSPNNTILSLTNSKGKDSIILIDC